MSKVTVVSRPNRITIASKGVQGAVGPEGPQGTQGIQGEKGDTGDVTPEALAARDAAQEAASAAEGSATTAGTAATTATGKAAEAAASADLAEQARLLGATIGFSTKADMDSSLAHPDGTLALVTNDPTAANNGTWSVQGGVWVQSADRVTGLEGRVSSVESVAERVEDNDGTILYDSSYWSGTSPFDQNGVEQAPAPANARVTGLLPVKAGDPVVVTTRLPTTNIRPAILVYDADEQFVRGVFVSAVNVVQEVSTVVEEDGFVRAQWSVANGAHLADGVAKVEINRGRPLYLSPRNLADDPTFASKADKTRTDSLELEWEQGFVNPSGVETENDNYIRSQSVKLPPGSTVRMATTTDYQFAWNFSDTPVVPLGSGRLQPRGSSQSFEVPEDRPYARFMLARAPAAPTVPADATHLDSSLSVPVAYIDHVPDLDDYATKAAVQALRDSTETRFVPTYRTPSQASGGVVSIIDDDGKVELYTKLYPFLRALGVPFGAAINPTRVGTAGYATLPELKELAADYRYVEIMNHGFEHLNMSGLTAEEQHAEVIKAKRWLTENGFETEGFVLPYGGDTPETLRIVSQYYNACYDYGAGQNGGLQSFDTMRNMKVVRYSFDTNMSALLANVTTAAQTGQWLVICTHVESFDWSENGWSNLQTLIDHIQSEGCKIMLPSEAFHVFGNLLEADNGFRITAQGATIPAVP